MAEGDFALEIDPAGLPFGATATFDPDGVNTPNAAALSLACGDQLSDQNFGYRPYYLGQNYSPAPANSTGNPGRISASGSVVTVENDVVLFCSSLPSNQFGYFHVHDPGLPPEPRRQPGQPLRAR